MAKSRILATTRVGPDDFEIFRIWHKHTQAFCHDFAVVIFQRPTEDINPILSFVKSNGISFTIFKDTEFNNTATLDAMKLLVQRIDADIIFHSDTDEFISGTNNEFKQDCLHASKGSAVIMEMKDRVNEDRILYNIEGCKNYSELCLIAPFTKNLTGEMQSWATTKVAIQPWPHIDGLHGARSLPSLPGRCHLDHFKWRTEWYEKAKRRLRETQNQGKPWSKGIDVMLKYFEPSIPSTQSLPEKHLNNI